jgi:hypothetical protein
MAGCTQWRVPEKDEILKTTLIVCVLAITGCASPVVTTNRPGTMEGNLVTRARSYLRQQDVSIAFTDRVPRIVKTETLVGNTAVWRVDVEIIVPAPPGLRIPPGTPTVRLASVFFDTGGKPYKAGW